MKLIDFYNKNKKNERVLSLLEELNSILDLYYECKRDDDFGSTEQ